MFQGEVLELTTTGSEEGCFLGRHPSCFVELSCLSRMATWGILFGHFRVLELQVSSGQLSISNLRNGTLCIKFEDGKADCWKRSNNRQMRF